MRRTSVLIVQVVGVLPDVEGEEGLEAVSYGVVGIGILRDGELAIGVGLEPHPAGAEEGCALGFEVGLEGVEGGPLLGNLLCQGRFGSLPVAISRFARVRIKSGMRGGSELRKVQVVIENLAGVVEDGARRLLHNLYQHRFFASLRMTKGFKLCPGNELVQVVHIGLEVLPVVESQGLVADDRGQGVVGKFNECKHIMQFQSST